LYGCLIVRCAEAIVLNINHMWLQYTHNKIRANVEGYSPVNMTGVGRYRSATLFARVEGL